MEAFIASVSEAISLDCRVACAPRNDHFIVSFTIISIYYDNVRTSTLSLTYENMRKVKGMIVKGSLP